MFRIGWIVLFTVGLAASCGEPAEEPEDALAAFRAESGLEFGECPALSLSHGDVCTEAYMTAATCFSDAVATCTPQHLRETFPTTEGDPIIYDFFVVPNNGRCTVVWFGDNRADAFSRDEDRVVTRQDCEGFAGLPPQPKFLPCIPQLGYAIATDLDS